MIFNFEYYIKDGKVEQQHPDIERAHALMSKSEKRLKYLQPITEETADLVFEDIYEAMREASQSLMMLHGYKPLSHEAVIAYIRDKEGFNQHSIYALDSYRKLRNKSIYEAQKISAMKVKEALEFAKKFIGELKSKIKP